MSTLPASSGPEAMMIRAATEADVPQIGDIYYRQEVEGDPSPPPRHPFAWLTQTLVTGRMYVAETQDTIVGYSGCIVRGPVAFLTDLFVRRDWQSGAIGKVLLDAAMPPGDELIHCTMSSTDPRAHALYARAGMRPQWPNFWLRGMSTELRALPETGVRVVETPPNDPELIAWDARISGRERPQDFVYWRDATQAVGLWLVRDGARIGYALVQRRSDASIYYPQGFTIGPIGTPPDADSAACVLATVAWASARTAVFRIAVPGEHPALKPLLDAACKIVYVETFCSSAAPLFDPQRYVTSGDLL